MDTKNRPILYLDIDDTLIIWSLKVDGYGAPMVNEFIKWALEHFEVRWLTMWCPSGELSNEGAQELSYRTGEIIDPEVFVNIKNPKGFINNKTDAIDFDEVRPWVWVEDAMVYREKMEMIARVKDDNFYPTNVSQNVMALQVTWNKLAKRFDLPKCPYPYSKTISKPTILLSGQEIIKKYRLGKLQNHDVNRPAPLILPQGWNW